MTPAILTPEHADRARRAILDHWAESLQAAATHARTAADQGEPDTLAMADARAHLREAVELAGTLDQLV